MKLYKGFDKDLKCRGKQYEIGGTYEEPNAKLCDHGFHACENPLDTFRYYPPSSGRYAEVDMDGVTDEHEDDTKRVGTKLHIETELKYEGVIRAGLKFIFDKVDFAKDKEINSGEGGMAAASGYGGTAAASGQDSIAFAGGIDGKAKASIGNYIVVSEWKDDKNGDWHRINVKSAKVDGVKIKADTFYKLVNNKLIEDAENGEE